MNLHECFKQTHDIGENPSVAKYFLNYTFDEILMLNCLFVISNQYKIFIMVFAQPESVSRKVESLHDARSQSCALKVSAIKKYSLFITFLVNPILRSYFSLVLDEILITDTFRRKK